MQPDPKSKRNWLVVKWAAALFLLVIGASMLWSDIKIRQDDPLKSPRLKEYKDKLRSDPADEKLKSQIRQLDLELRTRYFQHQAQKNSGVYLLFAATMFFLLASKQSAKTEIYLPGRKEEIESARANAISRWAVATLGLAGGVTICIAGLSYKSTLPQPKEISKLFASETNGIAEPDPTIAAAGATHWSQFRGPGGNGVVAFTNIAPAWGPKTAHEVLWTVPVPIKGYNSPILWGNRLFFSGANETDCAVYCFDAQSGQPIWHHAVAGAAQAFKNSSQAPAVSCANATMTSDGKRVFAFFGSGDLVALTMDGKPAWTKKFGALKNPYGHAASLLIAKGKLILQLDQGEAENGLSKLYAFDPANGQTIWQRQRQLGSSWSSPILIEVGGKTQIVTESVPAIISYGLDTGAEVWRADGLNNEVTPSPIFAGGILFAVSPSEKLFAIAPDGSGNVTGTKVVWSTEENVPDIVSPVSDGHLLFTLTSSGVLTCFQIADGKKQWEHDFSMDFHSSPSIAEGRLYLFSRNGTGIVVEVASRFKELFRTELPDAFDASPAFADGRIFLRGETNLWCIGPSALKLAKP